MSRIEVRLGLELAGLLNSPREVPLAAGEGCTLRQLLLILERDAPGAFLEPRTGRLRRHIHVQVGGRPAMGLAQRVREGEAVRLDLRLPEGG